MVFAKKKWGQNFLVDNNLLEKIIKTINVNNQENVLEIGPGQGALSEKIVDVAKSLSMVEICLLYASPSPRDATLSRMPSSA